MIVHYKNMEGFVVSGEYTIDTFTEDGTWTAPAGLTSIELLVVAGGGGGGSGSRNGFVCGGGGGGGGVIYKESQEVSGNNTYTITIGSGGMGGTKQPGTSGGTSRIIGQNVNLEANGGGGGGGGTSINGLNGGSGGGGAGAQSGTGGTGGASTKIIGDGNNGGDGKNSTKGFGSGGGGGGAGSAGTSTDNVTPWGGVGGNGIEKNISGTNTFYGAGGSGAIYNAGWAAEPANGIGGKGGEHSRGNRSDGTPWINGTNAIGNGNGGGGGSTQASNNNNIGNGGNGSPGIVIIKYKTPAPPAPQPQPQPQPVEVAPQPQAAVAQAEPQAAPPLAAGVTVDTSVAAPSDKAIHDAINAEINDLKIAVANNEKNIELRKSELKSAIDILDGKMKTLEGAKSAGDTAATLQAMKDSTEAKKDRDAAALELDKAIKAYELASKNLADATASIQKMSKAAADAKDAAEKDAKSAADSAAKAAADAKSISDSKGALAPPIITVSQKVNNQVLDIITNTTDGSTINSANIVYSSSIPILTRGQLSDSMLQSIPVISPIPSVTKIPLSNLKDGYKYYIVDSTQYKEGFTKLLGSFQYFTSNTFDFNMPEITSQCSKPSKDTSCDSVMPSRTDVMPDTSVSNCTNTATQLQERSNMLENIQNKLKNSMLSSRCTTPMIPGECDTQTTCTTQGLEYEDSCYKGKSSQNPDETYPPMPDMSAYIKKDAIPCWGCNIDY